MTSLTQSLYGLETCISLEDIPMIVYCTHFCWIPAAESCRLFIIPVLFAGLSAAYECATGLLIRKGRSDPSELFDRCESASGGNVISQA